MTPFGPISGNTWATRDPETGRHHRNGHDLILRETAWRCLTCNHTFDAAVDANLFACGEDCTNAHIQKSRVRNGV